MKLNIAVIVNFLINLNILLYHTQLAGVPVVQLPNGLIKGRQASTIQNKNFYAFEGIPYAAAPVGDLRFQAPKPAPSWNNVRDATSLPAICFQRSTNTDTESEDCLFINVYTPQLPNDKNNVSLPVMFYIHGGQFVDGQAKTSPDLFINNDVILVSIHYRLGVFGFLSTQDAVIAGNNGLKDQQFAIQWTHNNIHIFGGDPKKITIFGQSAGSVSCAYQTLHQKSDGLFQAAILESGSFLNPSGFQRRAREIAFATAALLDPNFANSNDSQALLEYLKTVDAKALDDAAAQYTNYTSGPQYVEHLQGTLYAPVLEEKSADAFLTKKMYGLLKAGKVINVTTMIGINSEECLYFNNDTDKFKITMNAFDHNLEWTVSQDMGITHLDALKSVGELIRNFYTKGSLWAKNLGDAIRCCSDTGWTRSIIKHAELFSKYADTYFYQFSYDGKLTHFDVVYDGAEKVVHGEELAYLFCKGDDCNDEMYSEADRVTRQRLIKLWTDFAKFKNPTPEASDLLQNVIWSPVSTENGGFGYLDINENLEIKSHPKKETYQFWTELYSSLNYTDFDTY